MKYFYSNENCKNGVLRSLYVVLAKAANHQLKKNQTVVIQRPESYLIENIFYLSSYKYPYFVSINPLCL